MARYFIGYRCASWIALFATAHHPRFPHHPNFKRRSTNLRSSKRYAKTAAESGATPTFQNALPCPKIARNPRIRMMISVMIPESRPSETYLQSVSAFINIPLVSLASPGSLGPLPFCTVAPPPNVKSRMPRSFVYSTSTTGDNYSPAISFACTIGNTIALPRMVYVVAVLGPIPGTSPHSCGYRTLAPFPHHLRLYLRWQPFPIDNFQYLGASHPTAPSMVVAYSTDVHVKGKHCTGYRRHHPLDIALLLGEQHPAVSAVSRNLATTRSPISLSTLPPPDSVIAAVCSR